MEKSSNPPEADTVGRSPIGSLFPSSYVLERMSFGPLSSTAMALLRCGCCSMPAISCCRAMTPGRHLMLTRRGKARELRRNLQQSIAETHCTARRNRQPLCENTGQHCWFSALCRPASSLQLLEDNDCN